METHSPEISENLKKIANWVDFQMKISKWALWSLVPVLILLLGVPVYLDAQHKKLVHESKNEEKDWFDVAAETRKGDLKTALEISDRLLLRIPRDFEGHYKKGEILLMMGDIEGARKSFQNAYDIFPLPKYQYAIEALEKK